MYNPFNQDPNEEVSENRESRILIRKSPILNRKSPTVQARLGWGSDTKAHRDVAARAGRSWLGKVQFRKGGWVNCVYRRIVVP